MVTAIVPTVVVAVVSWQENDPPGLIVSPNRTQVTSELPKFGSVEFFISVNKLVPVEFVINGSPLVTGGLVRFGLNCSTNVIGL